MDPEQYPASCMAFLSDKEEGHADKQGLKAIVVSNMLAFEQDPGRLREEDQVDS